MPGQDSTDRYDDSAFNFFVLAVLTVIIVPSTYAYVNLFRESFNNKYEGICGCEPCRKKAKTLKTASRRPTAWGVFKFTLYVACWALAIFLVYQSRNALKPQAEAFDPYSILGIDTGSGPDEIKKAYRKLSLKYHPDKNQEEGAQDMFIKVGKAYEALTDDAIRENWEKYGNPDGQQATVIGIALPSWLVAKNNKNIVLLTYVVLLVVVFPSVILYYWSKQKEKAPNQLMNKTMAMYYQAITESMRFRKLLDPLCYSFEFHTKIPVRRTDEQGIAVLRPLLPEALSENLNKQSAKQKAKGRVQHPLIVKNTVLLGAHLSRLHRKLAPQLAVDLDAFLSESPALLRGMTELIASKGFVVPLLESIQISQMVTQAVWGETARIGVDTSMWQLPHFTEDFAKRCAHKKWRITKLTQIVKLSPDKRAELFEGLTASQLEDVEVACRTMPSDVEFTAKCEVDDDEHPEVTAGSIVTLFASFQRPSVPKLEKKKNDDEDFVEVHAPFFPFKKYECWWLVVGDDRGNKLVGMRRLGTIRDQSEAKIQFLAPRKPGVYSFTVFLLCDSYVGFDRQKQLNVHVAKEAKIEPLPKLDSDGDTDDEGANGEPGADDQDYSSDEDVPVDFDSESEDESDDDSSAKPRKRQGNFVLDPIGE
eukprot:TRINITY_DN9931_c0_g1_i1.p1 TRINITY_DN9931_c0_g1~~TRINITY_DN9931_c0_g1_i1.p1  ORF type:complete len:706 (-),score=262.89 TRINITY_DN9931_c0_g1_i1:402-2345(-)